VNQQNHKVPFALKLIIAFLALDAIERLGQVVVLILASDEAGFVQAFVVGLWIFIDLLLIFLLWLRTSAGRLWVMVVFAVHILYVAFLLTEEASGLWLSQDVLGRGRLLLTLGIDALGMHLAARPEVAEFLTE